MALAVACILIYLGLAISNDYQSVDNLRRWGYVDSFAVWDGSYWGLLTSCLVHSSFLHLVFNVYWLLVLGSRFELSYGLFRFLTFFVLTGLFSSIMELAVSGLTGIGFSGVGYALFGFAAIAKARNQWFAEVMNTQTISLWIAWLFGCMLLTYQGVFEIGNVAHVSGLIIGVLIAFYFVLQKRIALPAIVAVVVVMPIPLFWAPWSTQWLSHQAYRFHLAQDYESAESYYSRVIERDPNSAWAFLNRGHIYFELGQFEKSTADLELARSIDPEIDGQEPKESTQWLSLQARKFHLAKDYESAVVYYSRVIERDPNAAWAIWNRGCVYHEMGLYEKSTADLELARSIDPNIDGQDLHE